VRKFNQTILRTLAYAEIFDYPLTAEEIKKYAIAPLQSIKLSKKQKYFYLPGREKIVQLRKQRQKWSREKIKIAQKAAEWFKIIPFIKMVAVTGALAIENSPSDDDIDLLIVTAKNRLWLTRLLAVLLIEVIGKRRRPKDKEFKDKICLNMFLSEEGLAVPVKERNLYTAHEVVQMKKLWDKDEMYQKFLGANWWVEGFLPKARQAARPKPACRQAGQKPFGPGHRNEKLSDRGSLVGDVLERIVKELQWRYMRRKITEEKIEDRRLMFHPHDISQQIVKRYQKTLDKLKMAD
jgi:hypothetical protein